MSKRRLVFSHEQLDTATGEILTQEKRFVIHSPASEFYQCFLESIGFITKINSSMALWVLAKLCINAEYNTGVCFMTPPRRKEFCKELKISMGYFNQCLMLLQKKGLISNAKGTVTINPVCFWKGDLREREKFLKTQREIKFTFQMPEEKKETPKPPAHESTTPGQKP